MKKFLKMVMVLGIFGFILYISGSESVYAAFDYHAANGSEYNTDLDGDGTREKIKLVTTQKKDYPDMIEKFILYVNDKKVCEKKTEDAWGAEFFIFDINPKDSFKQLVVVTDSEDDIHNYYVFNYKNGKCKLSFTTYCDLIKDQDNNNRVKCMRAINCRLGYPKVIYEFKIKKGNLVPVKNTILKVAENGLGSDFKFDAIYDLKVYSGKNKVNTKKVVKTLKAGDSFWIKKVIGKYTKAGSFKAQYALIDVQDADEIGWIKIKGDYDYENPMASPSLVYG